MGQTQPAGEVLKQLVGRVGGTRWHRAAASYTPGFGSEQGAPHSHKVGNTQNHRVVGVGRDLWRSSSPTPLPKQGHLKQGAQDCVQVGFKYLQRRRLHNPSGQAVPVLSHSQSKEIFPHGKEVCG